MFLLLEDKEVAFALEFLSRCSNPTEGIPLLKSLSQEQDTSPNEGIPKGYNWCFLNNVN